MAALKLHGVRKTIAATPTFMPAQHKIIRREKAKNVIYMMFFPNILVVDIFYLRSENLKTKLDWIVL